MAKTSFKQLNKEELLSAAEYFNVDVNPHSTNGELIAALTEDGVTFDLYKTMTGLEEEKTEESDNAPAVTTEAAPAPANLILVKMERKNASLEVRGVKFTRENPFGMVAEEDAEYLINSFGGFRPALQSELVKYYG